MDKIIGLGAAGCNVVKEFQKFPQYTGYQLDVGLKGLKKNGIYSIEPQETPEAYESGCPSVKNFLKEAKPTVKFVLAGSGKIAGATLSILEQIKDRDIHVLFVKSDERRLSEHARLTERATFGILQEYARSGLLGSIELVSNKAVSGILGKVPVMGYYPAINELMINTMHMINVFDNSTPIISDFSPVSEINRIATYGVCPFEEKNKENLFFPLDNVRQMRYYFAINQKQLEEDTELNYKINEFLDDSQEEEIDTSYGIYSTNYEQNFVYYKLYTNAIQEYK